MDAAAATVPFEWPSFPYPALVTAAGIGVVVAAVLAASHYLDPTHGLLTITLVIVFAFIAVTLATMIYPVPQTPLTEILVGSLATSMGGIVAFWMSYSRKKDHD